MFNDHDFRNKSRQENQGKDNSGLFSLGPDGDSVSLTSDQKAVWEWLIVLKQGVAQKDVDNCDRNGWKYGLGGKEGVAPPSDITDLYSSFVHRVHGYCWKGENRFYFWGKIRHSLCCVN
jgi:hypothetical protein